MLNRVTNILKESAERGYADRPWQVDASPSKRLVWMFVAMVVPVFVIIGRLAYLQVILAEGFAEEFDYVTESREPIATRDGRILSADGRVLAYDHEQFDVYAQYRWLQDPPNEAWLKQQVLSQLPRSDRRNRELVAAETEKFLRRRDSVWSALAQHLGRSSQELTLRRRRVQDVVEKMIASVERRAKEKRSEQEQTAAPAADPNAAWWQTAWNSVVQAVTTPPRRGIVDPLVVREELEDHLLLEDIPFELAAEIEANPQRFPGIRIRNSARRIYPEGSLAPHIVGNRLPMSPEDVEKRREKLADGDPLDYEAGDRVGRTGVERAYDRHLRGLRGERRVVRDRHGNVLASEVVRKPQPGRDVILTLDLTLQREMEQVLDAAIGLKAATGDLEVAEGRIGGGAVVVLNVHTGAVVAAASAPRYDLNLLTNPDPEEWQRVSRDRRRPFFHRATEMSLPPGSTFKALTAIAMLQDGRVDPDEHCYCQGYLHIPTRHRCYHSMSHGETDLASAICRSCNVYFYTAAERMGPEPLVEWAQRFGFGQQTGIDIPGESAGNLPRPPRGEKPSKKNPWYPGDTLGLAIGQSRLTATPLQIARLMAVIANDGYLVTPHVAQRFGPANSGSTDDLNWPEPRRVPGLNEDAISRVREGLELVVSDPRGTGYRTVRLKEVAIAGKTGTAENGSGRGDHAWFAGYVPADNPRYAFAVAIEYAGSGGRAAGPVAKTLVQKMLAEGLLPSHEVAQRDE